MPTGEGRTNRSRTQHLRRRPGQGASDCSLISAPVRTPRPSQPAWRGTYAPRDLQPGHSAKALQWTACCLCVPHAVRHEESAKIDPSKLPWGPNSHLARTVGPGFRGGHVTCPGCSVRVRASNEMLCRVMPKQEPWAQPHGQSGIFPARPGNLREGPQSLACAYREPPAAYARRRLTSQQSLNLARGLLSSWRQLPKERGIQVTEELASCQRAARAVA